ncbi:hypothetical protein QE373_001322 [Stenotrophomonas sp. SORGH_AS321]|nr:hypothetical protein [Stenotrophomonas sp. SORGH_AS_0321]
MLLPDNVRPENTLVFNGAMIIKALKELGSAGLLELYFEARQYGGMTMPIFVLSLDWLYLASCVEINGQGDLVLCS